MSEKPKSIVELAKRRKEQEAAAKLAVSPTEKAAVTASSVATGMQTSADTLPEGPQDGFRSTASLPSPISGVDRSKAPEHSYIALNLNQCILPNGTKIHPTFGYYYPGDYEPAIAEALYKELEYFADQYGLVERVTKA